MVYLVLMMSEETLNFDAQHLFKNCALPLTSARARSHASFYQQRLRYCCPLAYILNTRFKVQRRLSFLFILIAEFVALDLCSSTLCTDQL